MLSFKYVKDLITYQMTSRLSREEMLVVQSKKWRKLAHHVYKNSPYYSRIMKERGLLPETVQPEDFPVLTKQIIQDNFNDIVTDPRIRQDDVHTHVEKNNPDNLYLNRYYIFKTSGTTGKPGYFVFSPTEAIHGVAPSVARAPIGVRRRKKRITLIGFPKSFAGSSQTMSLCSKFWLARMVVDYRPISINQPFDQVIEQMNEFQPHIVSGYAKLLLLLADAQRSGKLKITPDSIDSGGEQLLETDRRYLKDTFGCAVNNHYGSTEGFSMGICRDGEDSIELFEDHIKFGINEKDTHITNLHGFTMPLIRYQMRDILVARDIVEAKPFRRVEPVIGRADEIPYFTTEEKGRVTVHPLLFDPMMPEGVKSFSMSSEKTNSVVFHIFIDSKYIEQKEALLAAVRKSLTAFFADKAFPDVHFDVVFASDYKVNMQTGKAQFWRESALGKT